jgi:hypothetical protein
MTCPPHRYILETRGTGLFTKGVCSKCGDVREDFVNDVQVKGLKVDPKVAPARVKYYHDHYISYI